MDSATMSSAKLLDRHLASWAQGDPEREVVSNLVQAICGAGAQLSRAISRFDLVERGSAVGQRYDADDRANSLLLTAQDIFESTIKDLPVSVMASALREDLLRIDPTARYAVAIDPIDGSSNIDTNLSIGSLFAIFESNGDDLFDYAPGARLKAAGFMFYGPQTHLILTCGDGSYQFLLDPTNDRFYGIGDRLQIPSGRREFAINTSNYRFWDSSVRHFIDDCIAGADGALGEDFNMRWNASLVAEAFRILMRGGVFLYPGDSRPGCQDGRLRLLHEALPLAMIIEQAGGSASNGSMPVMQIELAALQARVPLIFGCRERVTEVIDYISGKALDSGHFPLFANRSLFRS